MDDPTPFKPKKIIKDKSDRRTVQKVLDPKTTKILEKLMTREKLFSLTGCISTGKEANIYTCMLQSDLATKFIASQNEQIVPAAIKIYQTSVMEFKNRERYIQNELRFQSFCKSNPRKLVKVWAEKEVRNLKRLNKNDILAPIPLYLKNNVLIMTLIGTQNEIAPKLKDAIVDDYNSTYEECLEILFNLYNKANLVHADFSEYNLLYYQGRVYVIDVGQSIEKIHPNAFSFLISDITNINNFFKKKGVDVNNLNDIFEKITNTKIPHCLREIELTSHAFIPQRLDEIVNIEDMDCFYREKEKENDVIISEIDQKDDKPSKVKKLTKEEMKQFLKENKKKVKEENRIKRLTKITKKEKEKIKKEKKKRRK